MSLRSDLASALSQRPPWPDALTRRLAERCWTGLAVDGLDRSGYGTLRVLARAPDAPRSVATTLPAIRPEDAQVMVEGFPAGMAARHAEMGLVLAEVDPGRLNSVHAAAAAALLALPDAADATSALVRSLHVLAVDGPDYDASCSDPAVPFSIFLGVHPRPVRHDALRLAEGLLHEAMHLQLTLAEAVLPMVAGLTEERYSPWQGCKRPVQGVLHGLFVFRAVQRFLAAVADAPGTGREDRDHAQRRVGEIEREVGQLAGLAASPDLTEDGCRLAAALLGPPG